MWSDLGNFTSCVICKVLHVFHSADINAFKPANKIQHSPPAARMTDADSAVPATLSSLPCADKQTEFSREVRATAAGPLSSTFLDVADHSLTDVDAGDTVVMKLFAHGY